MLAHSLAPSVGEGEPPLLAGGPAAERLHVFGREPRAAVDEGVGVERHRAALRRLADFIQKVVGAAAAKTVGDVGWTGDEIVAFRMHLPSRIPYHNSKETVQRGNILEWEQPLAARLKGEPLQLEVHMQPETILYTTLLLFGSTIVAALVAFAIVIWWVSRRGRDPEMAESRS